MSKRKPRSGGRTDDITPTRAERFIYHRLRHVKGEWAGRPFELLPWQLEDVVRPVFRESPRRIRTVYVEVPRKNGKSTIGAALGLTLLLADDPPEPGAEIYSAAGDRDQASIIFDVARQMVEGDPKLSSRCKVYRKAIEVPATGSIYRVLSADAYTKHGLNAHGIIFDELHVQPNRELWDVLTTSTGARRQPLTFAITTAGYDRHSICWEIHDYALQVRDGVVEDPSFLPVIYAAEPDDDWTDPETWRKANPSLGDTISEEYLRTECSRAQAVPGYQNTFKRLHLNIWTQQESLWLPMDKWEECSGTVDHEELHGRPCYGAIDLSSTTDMTAFGLLFPDFDRPVFLAWFWLPGHNLHDRVLRDGAPYDIWAREGFLRLTDGDTVDYRAIKQTVLEAAELYDLREVAFDRWNSSQLVTELQDEGINMIAFGQGFASMSAPAKELERMVVARELNHGGHPVLKWNASHVAAKQDPAGNIKPDKSKSTGRIDGIITLVMAIGRSIVQSIQEPSRWEQEGAEIFVV